MKKIMAGFILGCILTFSISVNAAEISNQFTKIYDSVTGGKIDTFDKSGNLNTRLGSEKGDGDNTGGTLVLYNHSENKPRVEMGIRTKYDAGGINLKNISGNNLVSLTADSPYGAYVAIKDNLGNFISYLTTTEGYINSSKIITKDYLEENYVKKDEVQSMIDKAIEKALKK
jgi:hypothetical protein